jgi:hypothetical protein
MDRMPSGKKGIVPVIKKRQLSKGMYNNFKVGAGESLIQNPFSLIEEKLSSPCEHLPSRDS